MRRIPGPPAAKARPWVLACLAVIGLAGVASDGRAQEPADGAEQCALSAAQVFERASSGVVQVFSRGIDPFRVASRVRMATGSGFLLGDGHVVTNFHVVAESQVVAVGVADTIVPAEVVAVDPVLDLAILEQPLVSFAAEPLELSPADAVTVGQPAYTVGFPLGIGKSITAGIVSGLGRVVPLTTSSWLSPFIQTDASTSAGNSGGPLLDGCGRVIGVVTLHVEAPEAENIGFAVPAAILHEVLPELVETGKVARPWHGLYGQMVTPVVLALLGIPPEAWRDGFLVETVEPGSAADKAGLRGGSLPLMLGAQEIILGGDIITHVDGREILTMDDAVEIVRDLEIGQTLTIRYLREGEEAEVTATLEERPVLERDLERFRE